jgi:hypothetical protein
MTRMNARLRKCRVGIWLFVSLLTSVAAAQAGLPAGSAPAPVEAPHFPSRVHALVWRNWNLVETERIARVLGTSAQHVRDCAASMGLPSERTIPASYHSRLYLSVIRRNWHLLPYEQLLTLLELSAEQLAQVLREDDFLYIKLGSLKPKCERLTWAEPDEATTRRAVEIKALMEREFPAAGEEAGSEPPLAFLEELSKPIADAEVRPGKSDPARPRFLYSYCAVFGDPLLDAAANPFPDTLLQRYADLGVNGVWLHVVLRDLAPSKQFPEFGRDADKRLASLRRLVARARRFNVGVYLYVNEPRAMPGAFFKGGGREALAGVMEGEFTAMCTSTPEVRRWLAESLAHVFTEVPDLAGVFTITASENLTSCASHAQQKNCPRCRGRPAAEVIAEVNATIEAAVHRAAPRANVIAWDWGWPDAAAADVIARLPKDVFLQSVSEWSLPLERGGVKSTVAEYSISAVGPGPRATKHWGLAQARGLRTSAKVQANNTWELSAVPSLPAMDLIAKHAGGLSAADVDALQLSWSLGGYPSANLELFQRVASKEPAEAVLDELARRTFGAAGAARARRAWSLFSEAFANFPYSGAVVYQAPLQVGPANLLFARPTGYRATMVGIPYDDLDAWRGPYPAEVFIGQLDRLVAKWEEGLVELEGASRAAPPELAAGARRELGVARAAHLHFASVAAQARFVRARGTPAARPLIEAEAARAKALYALQRQDSRIGYEASNHYYYLPQDLQEKLINCHFLMTNDQ